jgi:1-acyl-sn-glycerol-3-phosphate acyltransferase
MHGPGQFRLLRARRFLPYFAAQALAALNDNLLRNILVLTATAQGERYAPTALNFVSLAAGLFILPVVLFSGIAGQLADRFDKARVLRLVKAAEILIAALAGAALLGHSTALLLAAWFLMGTHAAFLTPAKYGLLPQVLAPAELVGGNALLVSGAFLAILCGTALAEFGVGRGAAGVLAATLLVLALAGFAASLAIPPLAPAAAALAVDLNPWSATCASLAAARRSRTVFLSLLGLAWFWFYGTVVLTQLPLYIRLVLHGGAGPINLMLGVFAVAVAAGALLCERLSGGKVEIGLVPFGSLGLTLFATDLTLAAPRAVAAHEYALREFLGQPHSLRILIDVFAIGVCGGLFAVPLHALVQQRAPAQARARVMAAGSLLNSLLIAAAVLFAAGLLALGASVPQLLLAAALLNAAVALYIYTLLPEFLLRFLSWLLVHSLYRLDARGFENIPEEGAALLVCNHVSFVDALVISAACRRPIRFVMESAIFTAPVINVLARGMKAVPIASKQEDPEVYERAFASVAAELAAGQLVCIFPEGRLTADGTIGPFRPGLMRILAQTPVPVVPLALSGLWGSLFSRYARSLWRRLPRKLLARIRIAAGAPVSARAASPEMLHERVAQLYTDAP